jgi:hypothetical protein
VVGGVVFTGRNMGRKILHGGLVVAGLLFTLLPGRAGAQTTYRPTDLTPGGLAQDVGGVSGNRVIGMLRSGNEDRAVLLDLSTGAVTDLHPSFLTDSRGTGIGGDQQIGWGWLPGGVQRRALLWRGTAASLVQLNPPTCTAPPSIAAARGT